MIKNNTLRGIGLVIFFGVSLVHAQLLKPTSLQKKIAVLEATSGGRIGLFAINTKNNTQFHYRANELFPMCSTSKVMVVSAILRQSMKNPHLLQQKMTYTQEDIDLSGYAPETKHHVKNGMRVESLCQAAITQSDNTAMNLLMNKLGGPSAATAFAQSVGDNKFRLDRYEPELNSAIPGDIRDKTTPAAMAKSLKKLALDDSLAPLQQRQLQSWLKENTTGKARIRAGVPKGWIVGDKTGTGNYGTTNDIAILWPPKSLPIVVAIYYTQNEKDATPRDDVIAAVTRILVDSVETRK